MEKNIPEKFTAHQIELIRKTIAPEANDDELSLFIEICKRTGLDPFLREVHFSKMGGRVTIITGRDGYLKIANQDREFDGLESGTIDDDKNLPVKGWAKVWRKDRAHPVYCEAKFIEYKRESNVWRQYPSAMIMKVAEAMALKRSFAISGLVTKEELGIEEPETIHSISQIQEEKLAIDEERKFVNARLSEVGFKTSEDKLSFLKSVTQKDKLLAKDVDLVLRKISEFEKILQKDNIPPFEMIK